MDGEIGEALDNLIQLGQEADATGIKVGVILSRVVQLKKYPESSLNKYRKTFIKMRVMLDEIAITGNKIYDKLYDIYYDDLREKHPELEPGAKPQRRLISDGAVDKPRHKPKPEPKIKMNLAEMITDMKEQR